MPRLLAALVLAAALLAACGTESPPTETATGDTTVADVLTDTLILDAPPSADPEAAPAHVQALNVALDSLEAFVIVLEQVEGPIAAWNRAEGAARLLRYLEQNRAAFALDLSQEEAMQRYPDQIRRLNELEARRTIELERIGEDGVSRRILAEEMAKADAAAQAAGQE